MTHRQRAIHLVGGLTLTAVLAWAVAADCLPYAHLGGAYDYSLLTSLLRHIPHDGNSPFNQGRLAINALDWVSAANYFPPIEQLALIDGWNQEGTVRQETMIEQNVVASYGFWDYHLRNYLLENVRFVVTRESEDSQFINLLRQQSFRRTWQESGVSVYASDEPSQYVFDMTNSMLAIGRASLWASTVFPWCARGKADRLAAYDGAYLEQFAGVFLDEPGLDYVPEMEKTIRNLVKKGKLVVVDLSNSPVPSLFGVGREEVSLSGTARFAGAAGSPYPSFMDLDMTRADGNELKGVTYSNLDEEWLSVRVGGSDRAVCGYRVIPEGRVYFVGLSSVRSVIDTKNREISRILAPILSASGVRASVSPPAFPTTGFRSDGSGISFDYASSCNKPVLVSVTFTPRWRATIDGVDIKIYEHENSMYMILPAGAHSVRLYYRITWVGIAGIAASLLGCTMVILISATWNRGLGNLAEILETAMKRMGSSLDSDVGGAGT